MCAGTINPSQAEVVCDPDDATRCAAEIVKGEPSPLTGQVLTATLAVDLAQRAYGCTTKTERALRAQATSLRIEAQTKEKILTADLEALTAERDLYKDKALSKVPWYETPLFVAGTTAVTLLTIFLSTVQL